MTTDVESRLKSLLMSAELAPARGGQPLRPSDVWYDMMPGAAGMTAMSRSPHWSWQPHVLAFGPCSHALCFPPDTAPDQNTEASSHCLPLVNVRVRSLSPPSTYRKRSRRPLALRIM